MNRPLSEGQERFFNLLERFPRGEHLWDIDKRELKVDMFENAVGVMSPSESQLARFFANIWIHKNRYDFDLVDAIGSLDSDGRQIILDWVKDPFWP